MVVALTALLGLYLARTVTRIDANTGVVLQHIDRRSMGTLTFTTTINGTTYSRTYVQQQGESDADFEARAVAAWNAFLRTIQ
jgi:hypothetical protein